MISVLALLVLPIIASAISNEYFDRKENEETVLYDRSKDTTGILFTSAGQRRHCSKYPDYSNHLIETKIVCWQYPAGTAVVNVYKARLESPTGLYKYYYGDERDFIGGFPAPYTLEASTNYPRIFECYDKCDKLAGSCEMGDRRCVSGSVFEYCSSGEWAQQTCRSGKECFNGYCSEEEAGAICGDGLCTPGEKEVCFEDCSFLEDDPDIDPDYYESDDEDEDECVCMYGKDSTSPPCDSATWDDCPTCKWDESKCEDEEAEGCINKPNKRCELAVWKDYPTCSWDESKCTDSDGENTPSSCPVEVAKPCEEAIWMDYPTCAYNTELCDYIPTNADKDGDGVWDVLDDCPSIYGTETNGCPKEVNARTNYIYIAVAVGALILVSLVAVAILKRKK